MNFRGDCISRSTRVIIVLSFPQCDMDEVTYSGLIQDACLFVNNRYNHVNKSQGPSVIYLYMLPRVDNIIVVRQCDISALGSTDKTTWMNSVGECSSRRTRVNIVSSVTQCDMNEVTYSRFHPLTHH